MKGFFSGRGGTSNDDARNAQMSLDIYNRAYTESDSAMKFEARGDFNSALVAYRRCLQWIAADPQRLLGDERTASSETTERLHQAIRTIEDHAKDRILALQVIVDEEAAVIPQIPAVIDDSAFRPLFVDPSKMGKSSFDRETRPRGARARDSSPGKRMSESLRPQIKTRQSSDQLRIQQAQKETHESGPRTAKAAASNAAMLAWGPKSATASYHQHSASNGSTNGITRPGSSNSSHRLSADKPRYTLTDEPVRSSSANDTHRTLPTGQRTASPLPPPPPQQQPPSRPQQARVASPVTRPSPVTRATPPIKAPPPTPAASQQPAARRGVPATTATRTTNQNTKPATNARVPAKAPVKKPAVAAVTESVSSLSTNDPVSNDKIDRAEAALKNVKGLDDTLAKNIINEIVDHGDEVYWEDIAGLEAAKNSLKETVVYPLLRPDLFSGLREPVTGMLLFGPPGTGKTMLARAVATQAKATFFSISASSLTSKYLGESEKLVRALFHLAKEMSPSIIFVDEIDSLLSSRGEGEHESSRRLKTEFLIQWSNLAKAAAGSKGAMDSRVLVLAATNLPWAIDDAARRRFVRRQYIPLPEEGTRFQHLNHLIRHQKHTMTQDDITEVTSLTDGFSGSDLTALAKDAAMGPLRSLGDALLTTDFDKIRPMGLEDFKASLRTIRPSVNKAGLEEYVKWDNEFGSN